MTPAHPPLPTAWNLPFQCSTGSHTSISIAESGDGFSIAATRQCAGSMIGGAAGAPPRPPLPPPGVATAGVWPRAGAASGGAPVGAGAVYGPAGTISANVIVVSGSAMDFRVPQGVAANKLLTKTEMAGSIMMGSSRERAG
jgi:hypothetical protein